MKIELIGRTFRRGFPNTWKYLITDNYRQIEHRISEPPFPSWVEENEIIQEYREEEDWYRVYAFEIGGGLTIRHTPNEIALEIYRSYQFGVLRRENKIAGLEEVDYQPNEEELRRLKREMDAKMREIIAEETWQGSLEVIRDLFKENQETGEEISTTADRTDDINDTTGNNNFGSNCLTKKICGLLVLLISFSGLSIFLVKKQRWGKKPTPHRKLKF